MKCNERKDPVDQMVRDMTAKEVVDWLVEYHRLPKSSASTVESNLREQFKWHRLQGRLDRGGFALIVACMLNMRSSVMKLVRPVAEGEQQ